MLLMPKPNILVRCAAAADLPHVSVLAGKLVRMHHRWDPRRFMLVDAVEQGYARFFRSELADADAVLLVAITSNEPNEPDEPDGHRDIVGYAYGRREPRDWNNLLDACGALHDIFVDESARRLGVARRLLTEMLTRLEALGVPRVVLHTAWANADAQRFFESAGFRKTMIEMTREANANANATPLQPTDAKRR